MQAYRLAVQEKEAQIKEVDQTGRVALLEGKLAKSAKSFQVCISQNTSQVQRALIQIS